MHNPPKYPPRAHLQDRVLDAHLTALLGSLDGAALATRKLIDLYFNPPLDRVGLLQWSRFDHIVAQGLAHGQQVLAGMSLDALHPYRGARLAVAVPLPTEPTRSTP